MAHEPKSPPRLGSILLVLAIVMLFVGSNVARQWVDEKNTLTPPTTQTTKIQRLVALSPSSVEILYQLELEDQLVGVSRFCAYPPEASEKPVVGGYLDLDFESLLRLEPSCVILLKEQQILADRLESLGIATILVDHASTQGITDSITTIGQAFGKKEAATTVVQAIQQRLQALAQTKSRSGPSPRILVSIDRDTSSSYPNHLIAAGQAGVHQEYITMVGARNAYDGPAAFPSLSREKLIHLNPDIIIDLIQDRVWHELGEEKLRAQWAAYSELDAVRNGRIIILHEHQHMIPGPRFVDTVEAIAEAIQELPQMDPNQ
jgi:iron complex transport system substrate-binding protein